MTHYSFIRTIVEDPDHPGEMLLDLGDELCKHMDWKAGDTLVWIDNGDGTWTLRKKDIDTTPDSAI
jgi:endonuclease YncB( thermonuclease family)